MRTWMNGPKRPQKGGAARSRSPLEVSPLIALISIVLSQIDFSLADLDCSRASLSGHHRHYHHHHRHHAHHNHHHHYHDQQEPSRMAQAGRTSRALNWPPEGDESIEAGGEKTRTRQREKEEDQNREEHSAKHKRQVALDLAINRLHILESLDGQLREFADRPARLPAQVESTADWAPQNPSQGQQQRVCVLNLNLVSNWSKELNAGQKEEEEEEGRENSMEQSEGNERDCLADEQLKRRVPPYMLNLHRQLVADSQSLSEAVRKMPYNSLVARSLEQPALSRAELAQFGWPKRRLEGSRKNKEPTSASLLVELSALAEQSFSLPANNHHPYQASPSERKLNDLAQRTIRPHSKASAGCELSERVRPARERTKLCYKFQLGQRLRSKINGSLAGPATERLLEAELHVFKLLPELGLLSSEPANSTGTSHQQRHQPQLQQQQQQQQHRQQRQLASKRKTSGFVKGKLETGTIMVNWDRRPNVSTPASQQFARANSPLMNSHLYHLKTNLLEVSLYQILPKNESLIGEEEFPLRLLDIRRIDLNSSGWETFYVKRALEDWLADSRSNLGLVIKAKSMFDEPIQVGLIRFADLYDHYAASGDKSQMEEAAEFDSSHQPILVIYTTAASSQLRFFFGGQSSDERQPANSFETDPDQTSLASSTFAEEGSVDDSLVSLHEQEGKSAQDNPLLPEELCELPTFLNTACCDQKLVEETRRLLKKKYLKRPESFYEVDYERMLADDWTVSRFLLRCRLQPKRAARLMEQCGKFRCEYRMGVSKLSDFPIEFHRAGGLFKYAPDRVGNQTLYMRIKMHRRVPELSQIMREFILCCLEECDRANNGRGTAVIFDLTQCGLQNVDPSFLFWLVYSFRNYCPKGLSYIIVYNLPWILNATAKLALSWLSSTNRRRLRFVSGEGILDFIAAENLPDFMGGNCKIDYRKVPEGSRLAEETAEQYKLTKVQSRKIRDIYAKFLKEIDSDIELDSDEANNKSIQSDEDDSKPASLISSSIVAS